MSEWRDIATAPQDGTPVLVCRVGEPFHPMIAHCEGRWVTLLPDFTVFEHCPPTHWMPLPAPPVED